jgi:hypothetical protein
MKFLSEFSSEILAKGIFSFTEIKIPTHSVQTPLKQRTNSSYTKMPPYNYSTPRPLQGCYWPVFQEYLSHPNTNQWAPAGIYVAIMTLKTWRHKHIMTSVMSQGCSLRITKRSLFFFTYIPCVLILSMSHPPTSHSVWFRTVHHTYTNLDLIKYAATLPSYICRCILIDYFNKNN